MYIVPLCKGLLLSLGHHTYVLSCCGVFPAFFPHYPPFLVLATGSLTPDSQQARVIFLGCTSEVDLITELFPCGGWTRCSHMWDVERTQLLSAWTSPADHCDTAAEKMFPRTWTLDPVAATPRQLVVGEGMLSRAVSTQPGPCCAP